MCDIDARKLERLDHFLSERGLAAAWFARPPTFAWLTDGDNVVDRAGDVGVAAAGYDGTRTTVVTNDIEAARLEEEELPDGVDVVSYEWHASSLAGAVADASPEPAAADFDVPGFEKVDASPLRRPLTENDLAAYRALGEETARSVEAVCRELGPSDTERTAAAKLRGSLADRGIDTPVALVGGADRARRYRHYTPKDRDIGEYALVSVTARRDGLFASCTRTVAFDAPEWLRDRHRAAARVEATALAATRHFAGTVGTAGDVFDAIRTAYARQGHEGEWREHHQGGAAGYAGREWIATPDLDRSLDTPMAYAWNPTVRGAKSEDTVLVTDDGFEVLTTTGDWPTETVRAVEFPTSLDRPSPLER